MSDGPADPGTDATRTPPESAVDSADAESTVSEEHAAQRQDSTRAASDSGPRETTFADRVEHAGQAITRDEHRIDPGLLRKYTTDRRSLAEGVQFQWGVSTALAVAVATLLLAGVLAATTAPTWPAAPAFLVLFVLGVAWVRLRYRRWVYQIRKEAIYLERGVVVHRRTLVPYVRIQHVDTSRGPLERALGLSTLVVYTAGSRGADVSIPGLTPEEASDLQSRVKELAVEAEGGDAL
jgi:membrane protein YdbS with pleckstrin-like domain